MKYSLPSVTGGRISVVILLLTLLLSSVSMAATVPTLYSPVGAINQVLNPALVWSSDGNLSFRYQVATDIAFTNLVDDGVTTDTTVGLSGLDYNTVYYWRVMSYDALDSSAYSSPESFSTILASPALNAPTNNALNVDFSGSIVWNSVDGADSYYFEVSGDPMFTGLALFGTTADTMQAFTGFAPNTIFYWRVMALNSGNSYESHYSSVWQFTTKLETPVLTSPLNHATCVSLSPSLAWDPVPNATHYIVQYSTDSLVFSGGDTVATNSASLSGLDFYTHYYWRVSAFNGFGQISDPSGFYHFTTTLAPPMLASPSNVATGISINPTLVWNGVDGAMEYRIQLATAGTFLPATLLIDSVLADTTILVDPYLMNSTVYHWRVQALDTVCTGDFSAAWTFTTIPQVVPQLGYPVGNPIVYTLTPLLTWYLNQSYLGIQFDVQYSTDSTFYPSNVITVNRGSNTTYTTPALSPGTQYFWRVRTKTAGGVIISYSAVGSFTTFGQALTPVPSWPVGNALVYTNAPSLYYYMMNGGANLTFEVRYKEASAPGWADTVSAGTSLFVSLSGLTSGAQYEWQVRSYNGNAYSAWTNSEFFTVQGAGMVAVPILSYPTGGVTIYTTAPGLSFYLNTSSIGLTFEVQIGTSHPVNLTPTHAGLTSTFVSLSGLTPGMTYYWRARSYNGTTYSAYSGLDSFYVYDGFAGSVPVPSWPVGGAMVYTSSPLLSWYMTYAGLGTTYDVQYAENINFAPLAGSFTNQSQTSVTIPLVENGKTYYWRVRAFNGTYTAWSAPDSFVVSGTSGSLMPIPSWPVGGAVVYDTASVFVSWYLNGVSPNPVTYDFEYNTTNVFTGTPSLSGLTSTSVTLSGLLKGTTYYYKIRSFNGVSYSPWSTAEWFVTDAGSYAPMGPLTGSPANNIAINTTAPVLSWFLPAAATQQKYEVQYSTSAQFTNAVTVDGLTAQHHAVNGLEPGVKYYWRVRAQHQNGTWSGYSPAAAFVPNGTTAVGDNAIPTEFALDQNYPNPFNPSTVINFSVPVQNTVSIKIYDMMGQEIRTLVSEMKSPGKYTVVWNGDNDFGMRVSSGTYIYRMVSGDFVQVKKLVLIK